MSSSHLKTALEDLLRSRRLQGSAPPLRDGSRRLEPLSTGIAAVDSLLRGGFPRGQVSEIHGPASSGRTGLALSFAAQATARGALVAWVDPGDRLDPSSASASGVDLARLLWLRGERSGTRVLNDATAATATLLSSGLFEAVVLDLATSSPVDLRRLPPSTWIRFERMVEDSPSVLVLLSDLHVAHGPAGVSLALTPSGARWSNGPGPGRFLRSLAAAACADRMKARFAPLELRACD